MRYFGRMMKLSLRDQTGVTLLILALNIVQVLLELGYTTLFGAVTNDVVGGQGNLYVHLALLVLVLIGRDLGNGLSNYYFDKQNMGVTRSVSHALFEKIQGYPLLYFEDPKRRDRINSAQTGIEACGAYLMTLEVILSFQGLYLLSMSAYFVAVDPLLFVVILGALLPELFRFRVKNRSQEQMEKNIVTQRRRLDHDEQAIYAQKFAKETRVLEAVSFFEARCQAALSHIKQERRQALHKDTKWSILVQCSYLLGFIAIIGVVIFLVMQGRIGVGEISMVMVATTTIYSTLREMFEGHLLQADSIRYAVKLVFEVLEEPLPADDEEENVKTETENVLELRHVSFRYPEGTEDVLKEISLRIRQGETIALVGENGSGKTTLGKVLAGFYPPEQGDVLWNGKQCAEGHLQSCSYVFQDYNMYAVSLAENIRIGDPAAPRARERAVLDTPEIREICITLPQGEDTIISKEFGGMALSGGQEQQVAIARSDMKQVPFYIFDEPTAAIDPMREMDLMKQMLGKKRQAGVLLITHRIGIATLVDQILVLKEGRIVQRGSHQELMREEGEYKRLFEAQSQWYQQK